MNSQLTPESIHGLGVISSLLSTLPSTLPSRDALTLRNRVADMLGRAKIVMSADSIGLQVVGLDDLLADMQGRVSPP